MGFEGLLEGSQSHPSGSEGQLEGSEGQPEGSEDHAGQPGGICTDTVAPHSTGMLPQKAETDK